jgi:hypothetical protein
LRSTYFARQTDLIISGSRAAFCQASIAAKRITRDSDNKVCIYVNGELEKSSVVSTESSFLHSAKIGGDTIDGEWFNGLIDEVAIYNKALSMEEIQRLYQSPETMTGSEAGLVGYWNFDNDEGDLVKDGSPYNNHVKLGD